MRNFEELPCQFHRTLPRDTIVGFALHIGNHVSIALGSTGEMETQIEIARRLGFVCETNARALFEGCSELGRVLQGLFGSLQCDRGQREP